MPWQILDVGSIWMREFASALVTVVPTVAWQPTTSYVGAFRSRTSSERLTNPALEIIRFPLQRGYAHPALERVARFERKVLQHLKGACVTPETSPLICSTPFYAPVAELWPGPVVYYVTDLTKKYASVRHDQVVALDKRMCRRANAVCPNSARIALYLQEEAGCMGELIQVVPNATRQSNVSAFPLMKAQPLPTAIADVPRPIAGVIGNLSSNMDWELIEQTIKLTPFLTWVFVGPVSEDLHDKAQLQARSRVKKMSRFIGSQPYGDLQQYARAFDVAVLPYRKREPTYSGSSTRFYEHLAACRPMVATRGFAELTEKSPLLELADTPEEIAAYLQRLHTNGYQDGQEVARWEASQVATWEERARTLVATLALPVDERSGNSSSKQPVRMHASRGLRM